MKKSDTVLGFSPKIPSLKVSHVVVHSNPKQQQCGCCQSRKQMKNAVVIYCSCRKGMGLSEYDYRKIRASKLYHFMERKKGIWLLNNFVS